MVRRDLVALVPQEVVERGDKLRFRSTGVLLVRARRVSHAAFALRLDELHGEGVVSGPASGGRGGEESARRVRPVEGRLSSRCIERTEGRVVCLPGLAVFEVDVPAGGLPAPLGRSVPLEGLEEPQLAALARTAGVGGGFLRGGMALELWCCPR